jgi:hypothetical protein
VSRQEADSGVVWPTPEVIDSAPLWLVRQFWKDLPKRPENEKQEQILERIAIICEAHGLVDADGNLKEIA